MHRKSQRRLRSPRPSQPEVGCSTGDGRWLCAVLCSTTEAIIAVDAEHKLIELISPAASKLCGLLAEEVRGQPFEEALEVVGLDRGVAAVGQALRTGRTSAKHSCMLSHYRTSRQVPIELWATPSMDGDQVCGAVLVVRDLSDYARLRGQIEQSQRLAVLGNAAAEIAHEINNPLAVVAANSEVLIHGLEQHRRNFEQSGAAEQAEQTKALLEALDDIRHATQTIERITTELGGLSRPVVADDRIDVHRCVQWAMRATAYLFRDRARMVSDLQPIPAILGDEGKLGQVLINLLVNAAHAIEPGNQDHNQVAITTFTERGRAVICVSDSGCGIPAEAAGRVFDRFFTTKEGEGTGLGLPICRDIVTSMGGWMSIESNPGVGTAVRLVLPAAA